MSTCHVFAPPDHPADDARTCDEPDGGELVVFHASTARTEGGMRFCGECGLREDDVEECDTIVRALDDGRWETLGPAT